MLRSLLSLGIGMRAVVALGVAIAALSTDVYVRSANRVIHAAVDMAVWPAKLAASPISGAQTKLPSFSVVAQGHIPMPEHTPAAHASTLVAMPASSAAALLAFWFAGQHESAADVQIAFSWFDRAGQRWQPARLVVNKAAMGERLGFGLLRLGNPVAWRDAQGRIHLFVVATGLGGWAAGRVLHLQQSDDAALDAHALDTMTFAPVRVLPLSWLWNISHLVRGAPLPLADGGMVLPLYFEMGVKYPVLARFGPAGEYLGLRRISSRGDLLQPTLVMQDETHWLALMRDHSPAHKIAVARSNNAGLDWQDQANLSLDNPDASVAGLGLAPGLMLLAYNPSANSRETLQLAASADGLTWRNVVSLAQGQAGGEYSYPAMTWADDSLWVSYTDQRRRIAWQRLQIGSAP